MKNLISLFLVIMISLVSALPAYCSGEVVSVSATVDNHIRLVSIQGIMPKSIGQRVTVIVKDPMGSISYINETASATDGSFLFVYKEKDGAYDGIYNVTINGQSESSKRTTTFELSYAAQTKADAIQAAIDSITSLPEVMSLAILNKAAVITARVLVNAAISKGAVNSDIPNLVKLVDCEKKMVELETDADILLARNVAIQAVIDAITALPQASNIVISNKSSVIAARALANVAFSKSAVNTDITNLSKLVACENKIVELETSVSSGHGSVGGGFTPIQDTAKAAAPDATILTSSTVIIETQKFIEKEMMLLVDKNLTNQQAIDKTLSVLKELGKADNETKTAIQSNVSDLVSKLMEKVSTIDVSDLKKTETEKSSKIEISKEVVDKKIEQILDIYKLISDQQKESKIDNQVNGIKNSVTIEFTGASKEESKLSLSTESIKSMASKGIDLIITSDNLKFSVPSASMDVSSSTTSGKTANVEISFSVLNSEKSADFIVPKSDTDLRSIGGKVFEFNAVVADESSIKKIDSFKEKVTVKISYQGTNPLTEDKLGIYYFNPASKDWDYVGGKVNKENKTIEFKTSHFSIYTVMESSKTFKDIKTHWAKEDIEIMAAKHIVFGFTDDSFMPDANITRAEFAALIVRAMSLNTVKYANSFKDVSSNAWYANDVQTSSSAGLIVGSEGNFRPESLITREEMTTIIMRAYKLPGGKSVTEGDIASYKDIDQISSWAISSVKSAKTLGIIQGTSSTTLSPKDTSSRAQAATIIKRLIEKIK